MVPIGQETGLQEGLTVTGRHEGTDPLPYPPEMDHHILHISWMAGDNKCIYMTMLYGCFLLHKEIFRDQLSHRLFTKCKNVALKHQRNPLPTYNQPMSPLFETCITDIFILQKNYDKARLTKHLTVSHRICQRNLAWHSTVLASVRQICLKGFVCRPFSKSNLP